MQRANSLEKTLILGKIEGRKSRLSLVATSAVHRLLIEVVSLALEHRLWVHQLQWLQCMGSVVVAHELSCSKTRGIFLDQGSNLCPLH